jgi:hypothetical protein
MPAKLLSTESHGNAAARQRLVQLAAQIQPEHSEPGKQIYYSGRHDVWVVVTRNGRLIQLAIYEGCPC